MEQIHILRWSANGSRVSGIYAVHSDYKKACSIAEEKNKKRNWFHRLCGDRFVVNTYDVKG